MQIFWALLAGGFIGSVLGFVGAGGAMLSVPILIYGFNYPPKLATVAALAIVFSAAAAGALPKYRKGNVLIKDALAIWALGLITNIGGSVLSKHLSDKFITIGFAVVLVSAGTSMLIKHVSGFDEKKRPIWLLVAISLLIGAMTGIFGVGGGFLAIPILVIFFHISHEKASGTSLLIIAFNTFTSFLSNHSKWHEIKWHVPVAMAIAAVVVANLASNHSHRVPVKVLRRSFAILLYLIAIYTFAKTLLN